MKWYIVMLKEGHPVMWVEKRIIVETLEDKEYRWAERGDRAHPFDSRKEARAVLADRRVLDHFQRKGFRPAVVGR